MLRSCASGVEALRRCAPIDPIAESLFNTQQDLCKFPSPHVLLNLQREMLALGQEETRKRLTQILGKGVWFSPNVAVACSITIPPRKVCFVPVLLPQEMKPLLELDDFVFSVLGVHTRSRLAQLGLEIPPMASEVFLRRNGGVPCVPVINHVDRPISLKKEDGLFNFYFWSGDTLKGEKLTQLVGKEKEVSFLVSEKGEETPEGKNWRWLRQENNKLISGVELFLKPDSFQMMPPHPEVAIIHSGSSHLDIRRAIDQYFCREDEEALNPQQLYIAEVAVWLKIMPGFFGILDQRTTQSDKDSAVGYQTNSLLLQGGNTNSFVRVEIVGVKNKQASVRVYFAPAAG